jgi:hypothetical protein
MTVYFLIAHIKRVCGAAVAEQNLQKAIPKQKSCNIADTMGFPHTAIIDAHRDKC